MDAVSLELKDRVRTELLQHAKTEAQKMKQISEQSAAAKLIAHARLNEISDRLQALYLKAQEGMNLAVLRELHLLSSESTNSTLTVDSISQRFQTQNDCTCFWIDTLDIYREMNQGSWSEDRSGSVEEFGTETEL